jgi:hypothetical protein
MKLVSITYNNWKLIKTQIVVQRLHMLLRKISGT